MFEITPCIANISLLRKSIVFQLFTTLYSNAICCLPFMFKCKLSLLATASSPGNTFVAVMF